MRIFLNYTYGVLRKKTQRMTLKNDSTTDELLQLITKKINRKQSQFYVRFKSDDQYVRVVKGWKLTDYGIGESSTVYVWFFEEKDIFYDSLKISKGKLEDSGQYQQTELSKIDQVEQQQNLKSSMQSSISDPSNLVANENDIRQFLDYQLNNLLREIKKGDLQAVTAILRKDPQVQDPILKQKIIRQKQTLLDEMNESGWAPIHYAVYYQHQLILDYLLIKKVNVNAKTSDGWTPLLLAIQKRNMTILKILLQYPYININLMTIRGTALHFAVKLDLLDFVKELIYNKADQNIQDQFQYSPLDVASQNALALLSPQTKPKQQEIVPCPLLIGNIYKVNSLIFSLQQRFLCCNAKQGKLIKYDSEIDYPNNPSQIIRLENIKQVKMIKNKQKNWLMSKQYYFFQIFTNSRIIFACKHQQIAQRWVKGIFESVAYTILHQNNKKQKVKKQVVKDNYFLDDKKREIRPLNQNLNKNILVNSTAFTKKPLINLKPQKKAKQESIITDSTKNTSEDQRKNQLNIQKEIAQNSKSPKSRNKSNQCRRSNSSASPERNDSRSSVDFDVPDQRVQFSSFEIIKTLGEGSFGKVFLAKHLKNGQTYALKALSKQNLLKKRQLKYAVSEATILKKLNHPFIISLHSCFQTQKYLYMCLDYCPRGDLSEYLAQKQIIKQNQAKTIITQVVLAIQYLHNRKIIYRDLKPENILLCQDGYIKIADFGLSKENVQDTTKSFCGSPAYLSPEMINKQGVGKESDIYGIGCVLYQMLMGEPPYFNQDIDILYANIKEGKLKFGSGITAAAKDLISRLLSRQPTLRIKMTQIKRHQFFKNVNFESICRKQTGSTNFPRYDQEYYEQQQDQTESVIKNPGTKKFIDIDYNNVERKINRVANYSFNRT